MMGAAQPWQFFAGNRCRLGECLGGGQGSIKVRIFACHARGGNSLAAHDIIHVAVDICSPCALRHIENADDRKSIGVTF